jgi:hypothetical protein
LETEFDAKIDKYVNVYKKGGARRFGFTTMEYISPTAVINYIANGEGVSDTSGWDAGAYWEKDEKSNPVYPSLNTVGMPDARDVTPEEWAE